MTIYMGVALPSYLGIEFDSLIFIVVTKFHSSFVNAIITPKDQRFPWQPGNTLRGTLLVVC